MFTGAQVCLVFLQKLYVLKDVLTYGTALKCRGIQLVDLTTAEDKEVQEFVSLLEERDGFVADLSVS